MASTFPSLWLAGCSQQLKQLKLLTAIRRGNFVQSQLFAIYLAAPPSFLWVTAIRGRGDFAQPQLLQKKKLLPLRPKEGPCPLHPLGRAPLDCSVV